MYVKNLSWWDQISQRSLESGVYVHMYMYIVYYWTFP